MGLASKEQIFAAQDWDCEEFEVEKWGTIRIRALTARERLDLVKQFGNGSLTNDDAFEFFTRLIVQSVIDVDGKPLFDSEQDMELLQNKSWPKLQAVADRIMEFNGMGGRGPEGN